jgi:hypothetical protein
MGFHSASFGMTRALLIPWPVLYLWCGGFRWEGTFAPSSTRTTDKEWKRFAVYCRLDR